MTTRAQDIPHVEYIAQLLRHMVSVPASRAEWPKRGSVAIIVRLALPDNEQYFPSYDILGAKQKSQTPATLVQALHRFLNADGMEKARVQILFIQRARYPGDPWSGHIGFPGGKREPADASDRATAERETMEELGLDLRASGYVYLGQLDDTCAYALFTRVMLVISPHVYLQLTKQTPPMTLSAEIASAHWVDFGHILRAVDQPAKPFTGINIPVDIASRVFPACCSSEPLWYKGFRMLFGRFHYTVLPLGYSKDNSVFGAPQLENIVIEEHRRYSSVVRFSSDTELYLWGVSLCILGNLVDLSLPVPPETLNPSYTSIASPWPQMDQCRWGDVNFLVNAAHRVFWNPRWRKPWHVRVQKRRGEKTVGNNIDYFQAHFYVLRAAFVVSCLCKAVAMWIAGKAAMRMGLRATRWCFGSKC
ncbi:hypothetical protein BX070DRAFT_235531 [Coemansia spiralis]|nr:hypothetical protein BX070DRAFT_235531 [Coemansia spiralis]